MKYELCYHLMIIVVYNKSKMFEKLNTSRLGKKMNSNRPERMPSENVDTGYVDIEISGIRPQKNEPKISKQNQINYISMYKKSYILEKSVVVAKGLKTNKLPVSYTHLTLPTTPYV